MRMILFLVSGLLLMSSFLIVAKLFSEHFPSAPNWTLALGLGLWLAVTGVFGLCFLGLELYEFTHLLHEGAGPQRSAFLSAFFTLVGTHGLHVTFGLIWLGLGVYSWSAWEKYRHRPV